MPQWGIAFITTLERFVVFLCADYIGRHPLARPRGHGELLKLLRNVARPCAALLAAGSLRQLQVSLSEEIMIEGRGPTRSHCGGKAPPRRRGSGGPGESRTFESCHRPARRLTDRDGRVEPPQNIISLSLSHKYKSCGVKLLSSAITERQQRQAPAEHSMPMSVHRPAPGRPRAGAVTLTRRRYFFAVDTQDRLGPGPGSRAGCYYDC